LIFLRHSQLQYTMSRVSFSAFRSGPFKKAYRVDGLVDQLCLRNRSF
jgi:hypothetical protein